MSQSPLAESKKEAASLMKEVKKDIKLYSNEIKKKSLNLQLRKSLHESCSNNLKKVNELRNHIEDLKEGDEPKRVLRFDSKKIEEIQKLTSLKVELSKFNQLLLPTENPKEESEKPLSNEKNSEENNKNDESEKENDTDEEKDNQEVENDKKEENLREAENSKDENVDENDTEIDKNETSNTEIKQEDDMKSVKNIGKRKTQSSGNEKKKAISKENVSTKPENKEKKATQGLGLKSKFPKLFSGKFFSRNTNNAANVKRKENLNEKKMKAKEQIVKSDRIKTRNKSEKDQSAKNEEDDDDDEEEDEDEEEEEEEDEDTKDSSKQLRVLDIVNGRKYIAIKGFPGQQEGDLEFEEGEILVIKKARNDGWMVAQNDKKEEGLVPSNFLKKYEPARDNDDNEQEEDYGDEIDDFYMKDQDETYNKVKKTRELKDNVVVEEEDDEDEDEDEVENFENDIIENDENEEILRNKTNRSDLWKELKKTMKISLTHKDSLMKDLNTLPSGYRSSTLAKYIKKARYNLYGVLWPQLTPSGLCYESLVHDNTTGDMERKRCRVQFLCSIINAKNIPLPNNTKFPKVLDRILRVCLFDGQKFLSNIMMVVSSEVDPRNGWWIFNNERNSSCLQFSEFFVRSDNPSIKLSLLFELSLVFETQAGYIELSCGWCVFDLFDEKGNAITKKNYRLLLKGGTPFEKNVKLGNEIIRTSRFSLSSVMSAMRNEPQLTVRLSMPSRAQLNVMETLPPTLIAQTTHLLFINLLRRSLYLALKNSLNTETIHSPFLASFIRVLSRPDLTDVLRVCWFDRFNTLTRKEKKSPDILLRHLETIFLHNVYPIMYLATTTNANHYDIATWKLLQAETKAAKTAGFSEEKLSGLEILTNVTQAPFDTIELTFNTCLPDLEAF